MPQNYHWRGRLQCVVGPRCAPASGPAPSRLVLSPPACTTPPRTCAALPPAHASDTPGGVALRCSGCPRAHQRRPCSGVRRLGRGLSSPDARRRRGARAPQTRWVSPHPQRRRATCRAADGPVVHDRRPRVDRGRRGRHRGAGLARARGSHGDDDQTGPHRDGHVGAPVPSDTSRRRGLRGRTAPGRGAPARVQGASPARGAGHVARPWRRAYRTGAFPTHTDGHRRARLRHSGARHPRSPNCGARERHTRSDPPRG